jgi:hypothetical protein
MAPFRMESGRLYTVLYAISKPNSRQLPNAKSQFPNQEESRKETAWELEVGQLGIETVVSLYTFSNASDSGSLGSRNGTSA